MRKMKITVKGVPPSINEFIGRKNVWEYREAKKGWTWVVKAACMACKDRPKEPFQKALVRIKYFFPTRVRHDADNYSGKFLMDGLTKGGVIVDDDLSHVTTMIEGDYDKKTPRVEITITELEDAPC